MYSFSGKIRLPNDYEKIGFPNVEKQEIKTVSSPDGLKQRPSSNLLVPDSNPVTCPAVEGSLKAVITGAPRFQNRDLQKLAEESGLNAALLKGYLRLGTGILSRIDGGFSLAIVNEEKNSAVIAIDRLGIGTLAYVADKNGLTFATEPQTVISQGGFSPEIDPQGLFNYLYFHMIPSPGSIYRKVRKLQPGEMIEFDNGHLRHYFFRSIAYRENSDFSFESYKKSLLNGLDDAVANCIDDETPTGCFLSGGLDSSTVTGVLRKLKGSRIDAFSIGFNAKGYDETEYARAAARHFDVKLHEYYVTPNDVLDAIPKIATAYDEPFGNASAIPAYYCARFAREQGITRLLAGDGGDEIFGGNARYAKQKMFDLYRHIPGWIKQGLLEPAAFNLTPLKKLKSYIEQAKLPMPERMETYNFLHRTPLESIFHPGFLEQVQSDVPLKLLSDCYQRAESDNLLKKMLFLDAKFTLADNDLRKVGRMCDLAGVEVRYPLLDDSMVDFAASIPSHQLLKRFELRSFFRHALAGFLPPETLDKSKHGFGLPFGIWLSEDKQLSEFADAKLKSIESRGFLNPDYIKILITAHQSGHASYYGVMIWLLVMLESWLESHTAIKPN